MADPTESCSVLHRALAWLIKKPVTSFCLPAVDQHGATESLPLELRTRGYIAGAKDKVECESLATSLLEVRDILPGQNPRQDFSCVKTETGEPIALFAVEKSCPPPKNGTTGECSVKVVPKPLKPG